VKNLIDYATPGRSPGSLRVDPGVGGCVVLSGRLFETRLRVRAGGGRRLHRGDEVQAGFGRTGTHYWGFETQGVIPTLFAWRKAIGNGLPVRRGRDHAHDRERASHGFTLTPWRKPVSPLKQGSAGSD